MFFSYGILFALFVSPLLCVSVYNEPVVTAQVHFLDVCWWITSLGLSAPTKSVEMYSRRRRGKLDDGWSVRRHGLKRLRS